MANDLGGVWRTIGGRKVFIKDGQSISSAMKESGKFKPATKGSSNKAKLETGKIKVDPNDRATLNKIADSYDNIDKYEGLDDISKDYIKNRRQEMSRQEFTDKANEIHEKSLQKAIENEKTTDSDKRYNTNSMNDELRDQVRRRIWAEKTLNEQYNNSDRQGKKELTDYFNQQLRKQKELENKYGKVSEEDFKKMQSDVYKEAKDYRESQKNETLEDRVKRGIAGNQSDLVGKDREEQKAINKEYLKQSGIAKEKTETKKYPFTGDTSKYYSSATKEEIEESARKNKIPRSIVNDLKDINNMPNRREGMKDLVDYVAGQEEFEVSTSRDGFGFYVKDRDGDKINITLRDNTYERVNQKLKEHYDNKIKK